MCRAVRNHFVLVVQGRGQAVRSHSQCASSLVTVQEPHRPCDVSQPGSGEFVAVMLGDFHATTKGLRLRIWLLMLREISSHVWSMLLLLVLAGSGQAGRCTPGAPAHACDGPGRTKAVARRTGYATQHQQRIAGKLIDHRTCNWSVKPWSMLVSSRHRW
jgi:hypothetical protein